MFVNAETRTKVFARRLADELATRPSLRDYELDLLTTAKGHDAGTIPAQQFVAVAENTARGLRLRELEGEQLTAAEKALLGVSHVNA